MTTVLSQKGQIILSSAVRQEMHLEPGQDFEVIIDYEDIIVLRRISRPPNHGLIDQLQACPHPFDLPPKAATAHVLSNYELLDGRNCS